MVRDWTTNEVSVYFCAALNPFVIKVNFLWLVLMMNLYYLVETSFLNFLFLSSTSYLVFVFNVATYFAEHWLFATYFVHRNPNSTKLYILLRWMIVHSSWHHRHLWLTHTHTHYTKHKIDTVENWCCCWCCCCCCFNIEQLAKKLLFPNLFSLFLSV